MKNLFGMLVFIWAIALLPTVPADTTTPKATQTICHLTVTVPAQIIPAKSEIKAVSVACPSLVATDSVVVNTTGDVFQVLGYKPAAVAIPAVNANATAGHIILSEANLSGDPITTANLSVTVRGIR